VKDVQAQESEVARTGWEAFAVRDDLATRALDDSDGRVFPESGWGALLCWLAGPEHVARVPASGVRHAPVRVEQVTAGVTTVAHAERTAADQQLIDDSVDAYLAEAGLLPRPRGYVWVLTGAEGAPWRDVGELSSALQQAVDAAGSPFEPVEVLAAGRAALMRLRRP
jgi:Family of unknown function (DUF5956)